MSGGEDERVRRRRNGFSIAFTLVVCAGLVAVLVHNIATGGARQTATTRLLPLGDGRVSTSGAQRGWVYACSVMSAGGGAFREGSWIRTDGTFDLAAKPTVGGRVSWPAAHIDITRNHGDVRIVGNGLPVGSTTGTFPISSSDPAYAYDRNPNAITAHRVSFTLPIPHRAAQPGCLTGGPVGYAVNGVAIFDALDAENRDALAHEILDHCDGHPERTGIYHYHSIPACLTNSVPGSGAKVVGWMLDGYPIVSEAHITDAGLDACHGHTSTIRLFGRSVRTYHYDATAEYPYTIGCYHGTPLRQPPLLP